MDRQKDYANLVSGILGFAAPTFFAYTVYRDAIPQNVATWSMTVVLDALGLTLAYAGGNRKPWIQLGWFIASFCILGAILFGKSPWHWGMVETFSLILCFIAIALWLTLSANVAILAFIVAFTISVIPLMVDYWFIPQRSTTWLWAVTVGTCLLAVYGAERKDIAHTAVPWGAAALNGFILFLCVR